MSANTGSSLNANLSRIGCGRILTGIPANHKWFFCVGMIALFLFSLTTRIWALQNPLDLNIQTGNIALSSPVTGPDGTIYVGSLDGNLYAFDPNDGSTKWSFPTGQAIVSSPVIGSDGTIYVGSLDSNFYALNPDGSLKWSYTAGGGIQSPPVIGSDGTIYVGALDSNLYALNPDGSLKWSYTMGSFTVSAPTIGSDGTVYAGSLDGNLYALNPADGSLKWSSPAGMAIVSSPAIGSDGTVYVGSLDGNLYAFNSADGSQKWSLATGMPIVSTPTIGSDGTIYAGSLNGTVYALDSSDGSSKWSFTTGSFIASPPAIGSDGSVYVKSMNGTVLALNSADGSATWSFQPGSWSVTPLKVGSDGTIYTDSLDGTLYALNPADGTQSWSVSTNVGIASPPAIGSSGTIFLGTLDGNLFALNPADGSQLWSSQTANSVQSITVTASDGTTYTGSLAGGFQALSSDGSALWTIPTGLWIVAPPVIGSDGTVYVGSLDGNLYALNSADGSTQWSFTTGLWIVSSPVIGSDGTIYVASTDGYLYAVNPDGSLKWSYQTGGLIVCSPAIGSDGTIYVTSTDGYLYAINPDGSLKWGYDTGEYGISSPVLGSDGTIYIGSIHGYLYAVNSDGTLKWSQDTGIHGIFTPVIGPDGTIYVQTLPGHLYTIFTPPAADFSADITSGTTPLAVSFTDASTGSVTGWSWDFGDGQTSTEQNPSHTYDTVGTYNVTLTTTGQAGSDTKTRSSYITVSSQPSSQPVTYTAPTAGFSTSTTSGTVPFIVSFTDASTGDISSWSWDFGDGQTSTDQNPSHTYNTEGTYSVSLTATGPAGSDTKTADSLITVSSQPSSQSETTYTAPTAGFSASATSGTAPLTVSFTDASTGDISSWSWDFGDGQTSTDQNPSHTYNTAGTYSVSLTATGPAGSNTKTADSLITVVMRSSSSPITYTAPTAGFSASATSGTAPLTVSFTDASTGDISSWSWDFGDGQTSTAQNPSHTYNTEGTYSVSLTVTGPAGSNTKTVNSLILVSSQTTPQQTVTYTAPTAVFKVSQSMGTAPLTVSFTDASTGDISSWSWDFGDGQTSTDQNPSHTYNSPGVYSVTLKVSGEGGASTTTKNNFITAAKSGLTLWQDWFAVNEHETPMVGDFNGDGRADIITFTRDNPDAVGDVYVALSDGTGFGPSEKWNDWFAVDSDQSIVIGDFNGDGIDDTAVWLGNSTREVYVSQSYGSGMFPSERWLTSIGDNTDDVIKAGDVNGDGKSDLILFSRHTGKVYVALSNGAGFDQPQVWHSFFAVSTYERPEVADVDGDGKVDIVTFCSDSPTATGDVYVAKSIGTQFSDGWSSDKWSDWFSVDPAQRIRIADLNGDGREDFMTFLPPPSGQTYAMFSEGNQMSNNYTWTTNFGLLGSDSPFLADVNGDGKADTVLFRQGEGKVYVQITP